MSVQLESRPAMYNGTAPNPEFDLDAVDSALDRGDLETVRCLLGVSREAWGLVLAHL